jgi:ligand-binding sensor domain-containing protein
MASRRASVDGVPRSSGAGDVWNHSSRRIVVYVADHNRRDAVVRSRAGRPMSDSFVRLLEESGRGSIDAIGMSDRGLWRYV